MGRPAIKRCYPQLCGTQVQQHHLPIAGPTCSQARGAQRRALGPGSQVAPPAPRRSPARAVAGSAGGRGKGAQCNPGSRAVILLRNSLARVAREHPQRALRTCPARAGPAPDPGSPPTVAPRAGSTKSTPRAGAGRRNTWRPGFPGAGRTWLSHLARPRLAPLPLPTGLRPLPSPHLCRAPQNPNLHSLLPHPSQSQILPHLLPLSSPPGRKKAGCSSRG